MKTYARSLIVTLIVALAATVALPAQAQDSGGTPLEFTVAPYLLFPTMTGDVTLQGRNIGVDLGPGEIFENLEFGIMGYFRVSKGKWGFAFDGMYMDLAKDASLDTIFGPLGITLGLKQGMYEFTGFYEMSEWAEMVFGVRVNDISGRVDSPQADLDLLNGGDTWVDPFLGIQVAVPDIDAWLVGFRLDLGGFGLGSSFAWQIYPTVGYEFVDWFTLAGGYRALSMDRKNEDTEFRYDMTIHGPYVGGIFRFGS